MFRSASIVFRSAERVAHFAPFKLLLNGGGAGRYFPFGGKCTREARKRRFAKVGNIEIIY